MLRRRRVVVRGGGLWTVEFWDGVGTWRREPSDWGGERAKSSLLKILPPSWLLPGLNKPVQQHGLWMRLERE